MGARYILEQRILNPRVQLNKDEQRFNALANARSVLIDAGSFEQGYELMLGNFIAMELAFSEIGLRSVLELDQKYATAAETLREANRNVVNVLTAMKGYVDQVPQLFKMLPLTPAFDAVVKSALNIMHAGSSDYRFVYELRNHAQHQGTAIQGFEGNISLTNDSNGWAEALTLQAFKSQLAANGFKASALADQPERIDIRQRVRKSMLALGQVHLALRAQVAKDVDAARTAFDAAIADYRGAGCNSVIALCARRVGDPEADVVVMVDWDDVRIGLVHKNDQPPNIWPRRSRGEPDVAQIVALRTAAKQTVAEAAALVCVAEARWEDWEAGLPMPEGLFHFYRLQSGQHPTHELALAAKP
ncbi:hypothetical protein [Pelomonas sp. KK5]|uniref:hypothetical protein n=1 Tax=Pelomonas sp. KK5 TaxID=1855730 RepID=UPI00097BC2C7|nr:hypothetical protein [Pelomonas sp. KK5]